ncbi:hypothetical protein [Janibacter cremeus]|uniref:Uncharacterized protein n=1 Tax=Janibacter cremeus TaxID=1285192 RepID=A0A852VXX3_9MICO|nr:hypothetical protein [Janibacter cremeus]NYF98361.1 hypothetical protein [Janibacter cremeus]
MTAINRKTRPVMWALIAVGAVGLFVSIDVGPDGFVGGLLQGASFAVALVGAFFLGMLHGADESVAAGVEPAAWLPSRGSGR